MHRTRAKICGITHKDDALAAARAGADAIGMVFHPPAKRNIEPSRAMEILAALPAFVIPVGLFVDQDASHIRQIARPLSLRHIQLHGNETPELVAELREFTILKAIRVDPATFLHELSIWREAISALHLTHLQGLVLETAHTVGGSGKANDWALIRQHLDRGDFAGLPPLIAAGGLTPDSVEAVVRDLRPWAVDVSSGVESTPGRKDIAKIEAFLEAVRAGDTS